MKITVQNIKPVGNLKAFASIKLDGITVNDIRVVQQPGQEPWISGPQREYEHNGERKFAPLVQFDKEIKSEVERVVLAEWRRSQ